MLNRCAAAFVGIVLSFAAPQAFAQSDYPSRPVRIVVPSAPGGGTDTVARVLAQRLSQALGQQFFIENRPGAGNMLGIENVAKSAPDGYSLLVTGSTLTINHLTYKNVLFDAVKDFAPVSQIVALPSVLVINPSVPANNLAEFIALAKQRPGHLSYGSAGVGTNPHMAMELLKTKAGIDVQHIPYRGVAPSMTDVLAGRISGMIINVLIARPQAEAGKVRALGVTGLKRADSMPDVPTIAEAGVPNYESLQWFGLLAPAGTPPAIVSRLHTEVVKALGTPEMKERLRLDGADPVGSTPEAFAAMIKSEMEGWARVAKAANIQPE
jgi:tripartite-type tricarboxylate transporter receptor subunit TctC